VGEDQDKFLSEDDDFEVTNILDPDLQDADLNLNGKDLDSELNGALGGAETESGDDILDIDDLFLDEDLDSVEILAAGPSDGQADSAAMESAEDDFEFELTDLVEAGESLDEAVGFNFEEDALPAEEEIEEDIDFELEEEVVETPSGEFGAAEPEGLEDEIETGLEDLLGPPPLDQEAGVEPGSQALFEAAETVDHLDSTRPETVPEPTPEALDQVPSVPSPVEAEQPPLAAPFASDLEKIERIIEDTVRETVSQVLERLLPGLIEEVVGRELEKLRAELEED